jgi:hypothetical protein
VSPELGRDHIEGIREAFPQATGGFTRRANPVCGREIHDCRRERYCNPKPSIDEDALQHPEAKEEEEIKGGEPNAV